MFAVFGMNREYAKRQALLNVKMVEKQIPLTPAEYERKVEAYTEAMLRGKKIAKLSPMLSTPEIADQWMLLAKKYGGVRLKICIRHPHKEAVKKGVPKVHLKWSEFVRGQSYRLNATA